MSSDDVLVKVYEEIKLIREELDEIKTALIPEDIPTEEELKEIHSGTKEIIDGKYRPWGDIKKELKRDV